MRVRHPWHIPKNGSPNLIAPFPTCMPTMMQNPHRTAYLGEVCAAAVASGALISTLVTPMEDLKSRMQVNYASKTEVHGRLQRVFGFRFCYPTRSFATNLNHRQRHNGFLSTSKRP